MRTTVSSVAAPRRRVSAPSCHAAFLRCSARSRWPVCSRRWRGTKPLELRDRALFELIYSSGLRCQEALDLRLRDVSFDSCELRAKGKGRKVRLVPVGEVALKALERYLREGRAVLARRWHAGGPCCS